MSLSLFSTLTTPQSRQTAGFSIVELMITISIIVLVTGLVLARYSSFNNSVLLQAQAFEIGFDIRQAQQTAISVQAAESASRNGFGIHFDTSHPNQYIFFEDLNNNGEFDDGTGIADDETLNAFLIDTRFEIVGIRTGSGSMTPRNEVSITYRRPNFDGRIRPNGEIVEIDIATGPDAPVRTIRVTQTGQITIQ